MENLPNCPKCNSEYTYEDGTLLVCPECSHEWALGLGAEEDSNIIKDVNGNVLNDGDSETPNVEIKYKDKKGKSHIEKADLDHVYEHILGDGNKKPYIVKDGKKIHVYRPPYMIYGDDDVEGKAVSKDEVTK